MKTSVAIFLVAALLSCIQEIRGQGFLGSFTGGAKKVGGVFGGLAEAAKGTAMGGIASGKDKIMGGFGTASKGLGGFTGSQGLGPAKGVIGNFNDAAKGVMGGFIPGSGTGCSRDVTKDFQEGLYDFSVRIYKRLAFYSKDHFAVSLVSLWLSLAALAEGSDGAMQRELFAALNLPEERCLRESYYKIGLSLEIPGEDVQFVRKRLIIMDEGLRVNVTWAEYVKALNLLEVSSAPIRSNPEAVAVQLRDFIGARSAPLLSGNSILLDSLDYQGLWTTAFSEASIERAPFYDDAGLQIGMVDYMKIKKRVRLAHIPLLNAKVLELPVGVNGRYKMVFATGLSSKSIHSLIEMFVNSVITEVLANLKESLIPLEIKVPRFAMNFEYDANVIVDEIGLGSLWKNPEATWLISDPPAQPSGLYQRISFKLDTPGLAPLETSGSGLVDVGIGIASNMATGLATVIGREFVANRPFMFALMDTASNTFVFAGAYSQPDILLISDPPAQPSGLYQRISFKLDTPGLAPLETSGSGLVDVGIGIASNMATGLATVIGREFVANRPFMFALMDTASNTFVFAGAYSQPDIL